MTAMTVLRRLCAAPRVPGTRRRDHELSRRQLTGCADELARELALMREQRQHLAAAAAGRQNPANEGD